MKVLLLGGTGFIGGLVQKQRPEWSWTALGSRHCDLLDPRQVNCLQGQYDVVLNCAGYFGGIVFNQIAQREILYRNQIIGMHVCQLVERIKPRKFVSIGSACLYPSTHERFLTESMIDSNSQYHPSVKYSAMAKLWLLQTMQVMDVGWEYLILSNVYGPGEHLDAERSHFVGSLINRIRHASGQIHLLGTGAAVRDFLYATDAAEAICRYCELAHSTNSATNIGTGQGTSIAEITEKLTAIADPNLAVVWGSSADDGVLHKVLSNSKMLDDIAYDPNTPIDKGLEQTWNWFRENV